MREEEEEEDPLMMIGIPLHPFSTRQNRNSREKSYVKSFRSTSCVKKDEHLYQGEKYPHTHVRCERDTLASEETERRGRQRRLRERTRTRRLYAHTMATKANKGSSGIPIPEVDSDLHR